MANQHSPTVEGYPKLASHMGRYPRCAIYRRFSSLNSRNLLYMQAELIHLEKKLRRLEAADLASPEADRNIYSKDWYWLNNSAHGENGDQLETVLTIRQKLEKYNDAVIQQSVMSHLTDPDSHNLRSLQEWLERPTLGNRALIGKDRDTWGATDEPIHTGNDLLAISSAGNRDSFSSWFSQRFIPWFHQIFWHHVKKPSDLESGIVSYEDNKVQKFTSHFTTIVASLLPILAIVVLYCVELMKVRLGLVAVFTSAFTTCLSFFTSATRGEIFIATSTQVPILKLSETTADAWWCQLRGSASSFHLDEQWNDYVWQLMPSIGLYLWRSAVLEHVQSRSWKH